MGGEAAGHHSCTHKCRTPMAPQNQQESIISTHRVTGCVRCAGSRTTRVASTVSRATLPRIFRTAMSTSMHVEADSHQQGEEASEELPSIIPTPEVWDLTHQCS